MSASNREGMKKGFRWSFRTKFILVVGAAVVVDLLLSGGVALWNVNRLSQNASAEIQKGLEKASHEYLENYIETTALRANLLLERVHSEVTSLANAMQLLVDHPEAKKSIGSGIAAEPFFADRLIYNDRGKWVQNSPGEQSVVSVWGYLLGPDHQPRPEIQSEIESSAIFDLFGPSLMATGAKKLQMYYIGPKDRPIMRTTPYTDQAQTFDKLYPGHNEKNFWDFFFPGIYEGWQEWIRNPKARANQSYITATAPYVDAITGKLIVTFFHPLWNRERTDCAGAVAVDITLQQLSELISNVRVAESGFGFLAMSNGNVLSINDEGQKTLGLAIQNGKEGEGVTGLERTLAKSAQPEVAALRLPRSAATDLQRVQLIEKGNKQSYLVVLKRLAEMNLWTNGKIGSDFATLGFVVPDREIYASLVAAQNEISRAADRIRDGQLGILILSLGVVMSAVFGISKRITGGISALAQAAERLLQKDYSVRVKIPSGDEIGALGEVFNKMAAEIEDYTTDLEGLVEERTERLETANKEIEALNIKLKGENSRMGAELDIARRMQQMVLPKPDELQAVARLDIAGFMEAASEVGGDYYDVIQVGGRVKIGIGDVTGHGFESGVLMLMVQSVARTLLENGEDDPKRFLNVLNRVIFKNLGRTESENNLTLSFIDYTADTVTLTGQHEEVILVRHDGSVERIDTVDLGFPIGLEAEINDFISTRALRFASGDLMILYTDGVTEAANLSGELFGIERLCDSASTHRQGSADEIKAGIIRDLMAHIDTQKVYDDITLVVLKHL